MPFLEQEIQLFSQRFKANHASEEVSVAVHGGRRHGQEGGGKDAWILEVPHRKQRDGRESLGNIQQFGAIREAVFFGWVREEQKGLVVDAHLQRLDHSEILRMNALDNAEMTEQEKDALCQSLIDQSH